VVSPHVRIGLREGSGRRDFRFQIREEGSDVFFRSTEGAESENGIGGAGLDDPFASTGTNQSTGIE